MIEILDDRILGAVRWVDAVTQAPISLPLQARSDQLRFRRNGRGLTIIVHADGLEAHSRTFDLATLPPGEAVAPGSLAVEGEVADPTGRYLPTRFTLNLPRDPSPALLPPDNRRPPNSLFTPIDVALLPSPSAPLPAGFAEVRVLALDDEGRGLRNALARVVAVSDGAILGCGLADERGEILVAVPDLRQFAPGSTPDTVVTVQTETRLEIIPPPPDVAVVDWTALRAQPVAPGNTDPTTLQLTPGALISRRFPF